MDDLRRSMPAVRKHEPGQTCALREPAAAGEDSGSAVLSRSSPAPASPPRGRDPGASGADATRREQGRRRTKPWSVLDLIWTFGDCGRFNWSATFKIDGSVVVAHDGIVLDQFILDLTKAILNGLGREYLRDHTRFDGRCYVVNHGYPLVTGAELDAGLAGQASQPADQRDADPSAHAA